MLKKIRYFLNTEKLYAWLLISGLVVQSFFIAFGAPQEDTVSPAMQEFKAAQQSIQKSEDKKELFSELLTRDTQLLILFGMGVLFVFGLVGGGFILGLIFIVRKMQGHPMISQTHAHVHAPWGPADIFKISILFYFWSLVAGIVFGFINEFIFSQPLDNLIILVHTLMMDLAVLFFIIYFVRRKYQRPLDTIGLNNRHLLGDIFLGFSSYCAVLPLLVIIISALGYLVSLIQYEPPPHPLVDIFVTEDRQNPFLIYFSLILACTIGPFIEEVFFRGFCYTALRKHIGVRGAILVTAVFFAFIHYSSFAFIPIFVLGVILAYLYEKRGSLVPSITLHIVHNCLFIGYFFVVKRVILDQM
jgi:membrane protease YdiL (CAAX protease family)